MAKADYLMEGIYNMESLEKYKDYTESEIVEMLETADGYTVIVIGNSYDYIVAEMEENVSGDMVLEHGEGYDNFEEADAVAWTWAEEHNNWLAR